LPRRSTLPAVSALLTAALVTTGCSDPGATNAATARSSSSVQRVADVAGESVEVVAVGDIACRPGSQVTATTCRHAGVAQLTKRIDPVAVLALGDLQYEEGTLRGFERSYDRSWGDLKPITYPTPGNHEYRTTGANGYYTYFARRTLDAPGYYAFDLGSWRAYSINSNCSKIDCDKQAAWLKKDLEDNPRRCSVIATHHPRYSTGEHDNNAFMKRFYRIALRNRVDLMLAGHDHHYERYRPMNHRGRVVQHGVVQFVSGGGGKSHYAADGRATGSAYVEDDTFGVLRLVLSPDSYRYGFRGIDGSRQDDGTRRCV
jgi:hypothetical protein